MQKKLMLSSQSGLDHGHHHGWAMDAVFSEPMKLDVSMVGPCIRTRNKQKQTRANNINIKTSTTLAAKEKPSTTRGKCTLQSKKEKEGTYSKTQQNKGSKRPLSRLAKTT